jgi:single-strand DNA-binding protein
VKQITIAGGLTRDAVLRRTGAGDPILGFSVGVSEGRDKPSTYFDCSLFGKRGEALARYLKKGDPVLVHGEPYLRKYQTSDGRDGVSLDVVCSDFAFIGGKDAQNGRSGDSDDRGASSHARTERTAQTGAQYSRDAVQNNPADFDDDIPF